MRKVNSFTVSERISGKFFFCSLIEKLFSLLFYLFSLMDYPLMTRTACIELLRSAPRSLESDKEIDVLSERIR